MGAEEQKKSDVAEREEEVLAFWRREDIFQKTLTKDAPRGEFVFYDGPPFATGLPHMGHLLGSSIKDVVGRYKTMRGYRVPRLWGWDCHGLPIENIVEKKLNLKAKKDILELGIATFNEEARATVLAFARDWEKYVERLGRWVDFEHSYKTMDNSYIEGVWWALKKIYDAGNLYEGKKVLLYCPHCETPLSKAEIAMDNSYKEVTEEAVFVKFKIQGQNNKIKIDTPTYILAWTTTPWTLPGNMALAVGKDIAYVEVKSDDTRYIVARERMASVLGDGEVLQEMKGEDLVGLSYEPLYEVGETKTNPHTWTIQAADFVTTEEGTGIVHIAPLYGEDDYALGQALEVQAVELLDSAGVYTEHAPLLVRGMYYKKGGKAIVADLEARGLLFAKHNHTHSYPHCYRCTTALIYRALASWFINIQNVKARMLEENEKVNWYPEHLKHGRFKHIVEGAPDWTISRNRFWASPLPIWKNEKTGAIRVMGSLAELRAHTKKSGNTYLAVRHGESTYFAEDIYTTDPEEKYGLTEKGAADIRALLPRIARDKKIRIIASPVRRTKESAEILANALGIPTAEIVFDVRITEINFGACEGKPRACFKAFLGEAGESWYSARPDGGESNDDVRVRAADLLFSLEQTYQNETIVLVTHECDVQAFFAAVAGCSGSDAACIKKRVDVPPASLHEIPFIFFPHNARFEIDLHRPYIDACPCVDTDGVALTRVPEVVDCWVESGSMPFAAARTLGDPLGKPTTYPGDFIAEYIAQTRTWFYYMHAMGTLLFDEHSFNNCVSTGTVLAEDGSKMSKSKNNFTDPLINIDHFGADALRLYLLGSVVMQAEDMSFKDAELKEVHNRFVGMLWNSYKFYDMYADKEHISTVEDIVAPVHILDEWILARLAMLVEEVTADMDRYDSVRAIRALRLFLDDFSTWYVRRSRDRMRGGADLQDMHVALHTMRRVLLTFVTLLAPIAPFVAESIYRGLGGGKESVHLEDWPQSIEGVNHACIEKMARTRELVSAALELRAAASIKVRQPLASLTIPASADVYDTLIADEVHVKEIKRGDTLALDTVLTDALRDEGDVRELVRIVQDLRKKAGLAPRDTITLRIDEYSASTSARAALRRAHDTLSESAGVSELLFTALPEGQEVRGAWGVCKVDITVAHRHG